MNCEQYRDDLELYALGALEHQPAAALTEHLADGCSICQERLRRALEQSVLISSAVPLVEPPARLRRRLQEAIAPKPAKQRFWLPWAVAAAALLILAMTWTWQVRSRSSEEVRQARVSAMLQILGAPGTQEVSFTDPKLPNLHGAVYIHQELGLAIVIDHLPNAPSGWKYESWVVPKSGAPRPVEPFHPDSVGRALSIVPGPLNLAGVGAVAVSLEPENSHPVKPTTLVFAAKI
jgi:hypothetical protein